MSTGVSSRQVSNFPVVNGNFVIVKLAAATFASNTSLLDAVVAQVASIANTLSRPWPRAPKALVIGNPHATAVVYLYSASGGHATTTGLPIPAGQSLYLPIDEGTADALQYEAAQDFSVAVYF